jgi:1,4-alpha-glucan branching enzyme
MTSHEVEAIASGYHGDPFRILGPHAVSEGDGQGWEVRAFLPHAKSAAVLVDGAVVPMVRKHPHGVYAAPLASDPRAYRLRLELRERHQRRAGGSLPFPLLTDF